MQHEIEKFEKIAIITIIIKKTAINKQNQVTISTLLAAYILCC